MLALGVLVMPTDIASPIRKLIAVAGELPDALSLLASRSPGRASGNLRTSKPRRAAQVPTRAPSRAASLPFVPEERVLAEVRTRSPLFPEPDVGGAPDIGPALDSPPALFEAPLNDIAPSPAPSPGGYFGFTPQISFIDIPPVPPTQPPIAPSLPPVPPTIVPMVPEPATWVSMMLGFFALGAALRRRRTAAKSA